MEKDIYVIACDDVGNNGGSCNREFTNDAMKDEMSVVLIKVQAEIKERKGMRNKTVVEGVGNANVRKKRSENEAVVIEDTNEN